MARGLAGAVLFAVPVAVAAAIGFGTSLSGVAGGLSAVASGPDTTPAAQTTGATLNRAVLALASNGTSSPTGDGNGGSSGTSGGGTTSIPTSGGGSSTPSGTGTGSGSSGSSGQSSLPTVNLPDTGGATSGTTDTVNGVLDNVVGGVNNTLNGLLGH